MNKKTEYTKRMLKYCNTEIVFREVPDEITLAINITCCPNRCVGCHSPYLQKDFGEPLTCSSIDCLINKNKGITCVCFMGGDVDQESINIYAKYIKSKGKKVAWYSGNDKLSDLIDLANFDFIKIGHYDKEKGALDCKDTNQKFYKVKNDKTLEDMTKYFLK